MEKYFKPIHLACRVDEVQNNAALIEVKNGIATATNGFLVVKMELLKTSNLLVSEKIKSLDGKFIHCEVWKEFHKCDDVDFDDSGIYVHKNGVKRTFEYAEPQGTFFKLDDLLQDVKDGGEEAKRAIALNGASITTIKKIFETDVLKFSFSPGKKGVIIFPDEHSGIYAYLMPVECDEINRYMFI